MKDDVTRAVAEFATSPLDGAPGSTVTMAKQMVLNAMGLAVGSAHAPALEAAYGAVEELRKFIESSKEDPSLPAWKTRFLSGYNLNKKPPVAPTQSKPTGTPVNSGQAVQEAFEGKRP